MSSCKAIKLITQGKQLPLLLNALKKLPRERKERPQSLANSPAWLSPIPNLLYLCSLNPNDQRDGLVLYQRPIILTQARSPNYLSGHPLWLRNRATISPRLWHNLSPDQALLLPDSAVTSLQAIRSVGSYHLRWWQCQCHLLALLTQLTAANSIKLTNFTTQWVHYLA